MSEHHIYYHGVDRNYTSPTPTPDEPLLPVVGLILGVAYLFLAVPGVVVHSLAAWASEKPGSPVVHGVVTVADHTVKASVFSVKLTGVVADNLINGESTFSKNW